RRIFAPVFGGIKKPPQQGRLTLHKPSVAFDLHGERFAHPGSQRDTSWNDRKKLQGAAVKRRRQDTTPRLRCNPRRDLRRSPVCRNVVVAVRGIDGDGLAPGYRIHGEDPARRNDVAAVGKLRSPIVDTAPHAACDVPRSAGGYAQGTQPKDIIAETEPVDARSPKEIQMFSAGVSLQARLGFATSLVRHEHAARETAFDAPPH